MLQSLGAELVESTGPGYTDDPAIPNMAFTFEHAIAEVVPFHMPEILSWQKDGKPEFAVPGYDVDEPRVLGAAARAESPWPANLDFRRIFGSAPEDEEAITGYGFSFQLAEYLVRRGDARVFDWKTLNDNAKYFSDARRAAMANWENKAIDIRTDDVAFIMRRKEVMRMAALKVLAQNDVDVFVNPPLLALPGKIGQPSGGGGGGSAAGHGYGARLGIPEVFVPAGFATRDLRARVRAERRRVGIRLEAGHDADEASSTRCRSRSDSGPVRVTRPSCSRSHPRTRARRSIVRRPRVRPGARAAPVFGPVTRRRRHAGVSARCRA